MLSNSDSYEVTLLREDLLGVEECTRASSQPTICQQWPCSIPNNNRVKAGQKVREIERNKDSLLIRPAHETICAIVLNGKKGNGRKEERRFDIENSSLLEQ